MRWIYIYIFSACKPGFFGTYCEMHCPPGNFGEDCGGVCSPICPTSECDRVYGCSGINGKNVLEASTKGKYNTHVFLVLIWTCKEYKFYNITAVLL